MSGPDDIAAAARLAAIEAERERRRRRWPYEDTLMPPSDPVPTPPLKTKGGRPRRYATNADRQKAYRQRHKAE
jgi:hypothetical protein